MRRWLIVAVVAFVACGSGSTDERAQAIVSCESAARGEASGAPGSASASSASIVSDETDTVSGSTSNVHLRVFTVTGVAAGRRYTCTTTRAPEDGKFRPLVKFEP